MIPPALNIPLWWDLKCLTAQGYDREGFGVRSGEGLHENTPERFEVHEGIRGPASASPRPHQISEIRKSDLIFSPSPWTRLASRCVWPTFHFFGTEHGRYAWIRISTHKAVKNDCVQEKRFGLLNTGIYLILSVGADRLMLPGFSQMNSCD